MQRRRILSALMEPLDRERRLVHDQYDRMAQGLVSYTSDHPLSGRWSSLEDAEFQVASNTKNGSVLALDAAE